jgi:hypothetical protein
MKMNKVTVHNVMLNVPLVNLIQIVKPVVESESTHHIVNAQPELMKTNKVSVLLVPTNVKNVLMMLTSVLNVLKKDNQVLNTYVHV